MVPIKIKVLRRFASVKKTPKKQNLTCSIFCVLIRFKIFLK